MVENIQRHTLSPKAFEELKEITQAELGNSLSDQEIEEMGRRLLKVFDLIKPTQAEKTIIQVTDKEFTVLKFLHEEIYHKKQSPSVRDVAQVLGVSSSRSGARFLNKLMGGGLVYRNEEGSLELKDGIRGC